jgi:hypothetical protein
MSNRISGIVEGTLNGNLLQLKGNWTYNLGKPKREGIVNADGRVPGYKETGQVPYIEGEITDASDFNVANFLTTDDATFTLKLANGKIIVLRDAWYAGDGDIGSEEANIQTRFEGKSAEEIR